MAWMKNRLLILRGRHKEQLALLPVQRNAREKAEVERQVLRLVVEKNGLSLRKVIELMGEVHQVEPVMVKLSVIMLRHKRLIDKDRDNSLVPTELALPRKSDLIGL